MQSEHRLSRIAKVTYLDHPRFTLATDIDVYFCDPQSPWQRGSNENTNRIAETGLSQGNGLVRAYTGPSQQDRPPVKQATQKDIAI